MEMNASKVEVVVLSKTQRAIENEYGYIFPERPEPDKLVIERPAASGSVSVIYNYIVTWR